MKELADAIEKASKNYTRSVTIPNGDVRIVVAALRVAEKNIRLEDEMRDAMGRQLDRANALLIKERFGV